MSDVSIESHEDDSVTLRVGTLTAHIRGASWREAVEAAHVLGSVQANRIEARKLTRKLSGIAYELRALDDAMRAADHHVQALVQYAAPENESDG